jgi:hypothetical protein
VTASPAVDPEARPTPIEPALVAEPAPPPTPVRQAPVARRALVGGLALAGLVVTSAALAVALHRNGHTQGDDFALYLRQARSIFDGDIADVVADNRFSVLYSTGRFSPYAYPWGWPLLLAPFIHLWGLDYDRLKLVEVAAFCAWLMLVHGIIRRRAGRVLALGVTAVVATAPMLLAHTDQLLSEYPAAAAVALFIWWWDRVRARHRLTAAAPRDLVILGTLAAVAFNVRRETLVLVFAIAVIQVVELVALVRRRRRRGRPVHVPWRALATPYLAFVASAVLIQLVLPSMLFPDNGDHARYIGARIGDYTGDLTEQLGLGSHPAVGLLVVGLAVVGMIVGCRRRPALDGPLAVITVLSALAISTHFRMVGRYYFQILPWVVYFATVAVTAGVGLVLRSRRARRWAPRLAILPLLYLVVVHAAVLPGDIADARDFNRGGRQQIGPTSPAVSPIFAAVSEYTRPDDVIAYFRARTMTLYTDRRAIQTTDIERVRDVADFFAQQRGSTYYQPELTTEEADELGFTMVWSDNNWILWRVPSPIPG